MKKKKTVQDFRRISMVGKGTYGMVFRAASKANCDVALKMIKCDEGMVSGNDIEVFLFFFF